MNDRDLFFRNLAQTSPFPLALEIARAEGLYMYDARGRQYMDLISGISVSALGHRHPAVVSAVKEQADKYMHLMVYGEFVQSPQVRLAALLTKYLPGSLNQVYFVNSGSEAVEGALKLAKRYTGRHNMVSFYNAYHGSSHGSLSVTGNEDLKRAFRPLLPNVYHLPFGDVDALEAIDRNTACVIIEPIQGEAGAVTAEPAFFKELRKRCSDTGALLIMDEIQAGMGRTGKLWAFEHYGVEPDILTLAKGLGGGLPLGAFIADKNIMQSLTRDPVLGHITTFGGNAISAAASLACMTVITAEKLWEKAEELGNRFKEQLQHHEIKNINGKGLLLALEFDSFKQCKAIIDKCIEKGLITDWFLFASHCMRIAPPLIIGQEDVDRACTIILEAIEESNY